MHLGSCILHQVFGDLTGGETPVPIPNTEVKPTRADGTDMVTCWESRSLPRLYVKGQLTAGLFHFGCPEKTTKTPATKNHKSKNFTL